MRCADSMLETCRNSCRSHGNAARLASINTERDPSLCGYGELQRHPISSFRRRWHGWINGAFGNAYVPWGGGPSGSRGGRDIMNSVGASDLGVKWKTTRLTGSLGAEVAGVDINAFGKDDAGPLAELIARRHVLLFRGQSVDNEQ